MVRAAGGNHDRGVNSPSQLHNRASDIVEAARGFQAAAEEPASHAAVPDSLAALEEALQVLSAAWYQLAGDASPGIVERPCGPGSEEPSWPWFDGRSREEEVRSLARCMTSPRRSPAVLVRAGRRDRGSRP
jgi:hypothetical protein